MFVDDIRYVVLTYVNDKVPKGNEIHARMHENSYLFLSFLLVFFRRLVSVVLRGTLLAYYFEKSVKMYKFFPQSSFGWFTLK